jgi:hypothetical protein
MLGRGWTVLVGWEDAVLRFFEGGGCFFKALLVSFVLLVFMDKVACCHDFEASKENHDCCVVRKQRVCLMIEETR